MMLALVSGAIAGAFHVLSGPDHVAAIAPLALAARHRGWRTGFTWGLGHASGVVAVAVAAVLLREALPPIGDLSAWGERVVGGALITLGLWSVAHAANVRTTPHAHGPLRHEHAAVQAGPAWARRNRSRPRGLPGRHPARHRGQLALLRRASGAGPADTGGILRLHCSVWRRHGRQHVGVCRCHRPHRPAHGGLVAPGVDGDDWSGGDTRRRRLDDRGGVLAGSLRCLSPSP